MPSAFLSDDLGPYIEADPNSDLDYSIITWLEGLIFSNISWSITPPVANVPHSSQINSAPVTINGVTYQVGEVASAWLKDLQAGQEYVVTLHATFSGNRIDDRSFRVKCRQK